MDIAFIDKQFGSLLNCRAPVKIIKCGKKGCIYYSKEKQFAVYANVLADQDVVDKTGAGDCLNGVFLNLLQQGADEKPALQTAVRVATESVKRKGMLHLKLPRLEKNDLEEDLEM